MSTVDLRLGDCLELMKALPDKSVDAVITDPPFFTPATHYQSRISWGRCWGDLSVLGQAFFDWMQEWKRLVKLDGHLFIFCHDESYPVFYPVAFGLFDTVGALVWNKGRIGLGNTFRHQFELVLWAHDTGAFTDGHGEMHSDILNHAPTLSEDREHPVEKPPSLMQELIHVCTKTNAVILDSFMGSGTTGVASIKLGRSFIGMEINPQYFEIAQRRIADAQKQMRLL